MSKIFFYIYCILLTLLVMFSYLFVDQNILYMQSIYSNFANTSRLAVSISYALFVSIFFYFFIHILNAIHIKKVSFQTFKKYLKATAIILVFAYPAMLSFDIFNYITTAKVIYFYHENPYVIMPIELVNEPWLSFTRATNKIALYGPFWIILTAIAFAISFGNFFLMLFSTKLLVTIFYFGTVWLLWKMTKNLFAVAFFALNPLVVIETVVSGHNDIVMMFLAILAIYFLKKKKILLACIFLLLSILIKYATVFLIPVFIYAFIKNLRNKEISWNKVYMYSMLLMVAIFLLSVFREEIYPWYAIWFLPFVSLIKPTKWLYIIVGSFSYGLLLSYLPYMVSGSYLWPSAIYKDSIMFFVPVMVILVIVFTKRIWQKKFFQ